MAEIKKERDYMFDTFRGLLMLSIPMSHFTKMSGNLYGHLYGNGAFPQDSLAGFVYITINVFVMQAFMFLSGYFSKKPERARETAFKTFMWPYLVWTTVYFLIRIFFFGRAHLSYLNPPFALWFLFALFFYRFFLVDMVKFKWLFPTSIAMMFIAGWVPEFGDFMALGRASSYFPFFLIGYYCSKERLAWIQQLKKKPAVLVLLAAVLVTASILLCKFGPNVGWFLLRESYHNFKGMAWWQDSLGRIMILALGSAWIILMVNIIPSKKNFLSFVGMNTMPVYIFHLTLRYVIDFYGLFVGFAGCLVVAWFAIISLIHKKVQSTVAYAIAIVASIIGIYFFFSSGCLAPWYNLCPKNPVFFYLPVYGGALTCGCSFVAPFWVKLYDLIVDGPGYLSKAAVWLKGPGYVEEDEANK
ncbi:MAG: acyltransferase family protein [Firmicutes bacterium]|nr:acyltransferase family protein [Bacillota bacterium]